MVITVNPSHTGHIRNMSVRYGEKYDCSIAITVILEGIQNLELLIPNAHTPDALVQCPAYWCLGDAENLVTSHRDDRYEMLSCVELPIKSGRSRHIRWEITWLGGIRESSDEWS